MKLENLKSGSSPIKFSQQPRWFPITLILLVAACLYLYKLSAEGLWLDELTSIEDVKDGEGLPPRNLVRPLYYVLLWIWMSVGESDAWLRGLSIPFALGSILLTYQLGRCVAGQPEGLVAALLLALSPLFINHTQEIRMYAMSACLGLGGTLVLTNALLIQKSQPPGHIAIGGWASMRLLAMLTTPLNITLLGPDIWLILARFRTQRRALLRFGTWLLLMAILWSPSLLAVAFFVSPSSEYATQAHVTSRSFPTPLHIVRMLKFFTVWPFEVQSNAIIALFYKGFTAVLLGVIGVGLIRKHRSSRLFWVTAWAFLPLVMIIIFSYVSISLWVQRYLLFVCPYILILVAAGLVRLWRQWRIAAVIIGIAYLVAVSGGLGRYYTIQDRPDYKFTLQTINSQEKPGDVIVWSLYYRKALAHYYNGSAHIYWKPTRNIDNQADVETWINSFPLRQTRIWLVLNVDEETYPMFYEALEENFQIQQNQVFEKGSKVFLLTQH